MPCSGRTGAIAAPEFPDNMPAEAVAGVELTDRAQFSRQVWHALHLEQQHADDVLIEYVRSRQNAFQGVELPLLQCNDCWFERDDFAGAVFDKPYLRRVRFVACRLMGSTLTDGDLQDVVFERCRLDMARQWTTRYAAVMFDQCDMREASFDGSDLSGVVFRNCDLSGADLRNTRLRGADLRGSTIAGMQIGAGDLAGAIVDAQQAVELISLFGVVVRNSEA